MISPKRGTPLVNLRYLARVSGRENEGEQNYHTDCDDAKPRSSNRLNPGGWTKRRERAQVRTRSRLRPVARHHERPRAMRCTSRRWPRCGGAGSRQAPIAQVEGRAATTPSRRGSREPAARSNAALGVQRILPETILSFLASIEVPDVRVDECRQAFTGNGQPFHLSCWRYRRFRTCRGRHECV